MNHDDSSIAYFARTNWRDKGKLFGIRRRDRRSHMYVIGKTGTGKSTLLKTLALQDLRGGEGFALLDPHGDLVEEIYASARGEREGDVIYFNVVDRARLPHFNPLAGIPADRHALAVANLVEVFKKIWTDDGWGPRLEHLLRNVLFTLLETPGATFALIPRLLSDKDVRRPIVDAVSNEEVRTFWAKEFAGYSPAFRAVVTAPLLNKVGGFLTDPLMREILCGEGESFDPREVMDSGQVLLVNLAKGRIGEGPAQLLGALLVAHLGLAGLGRADVRESDRRDFFIYLDEFQTFTTLSLATMLAELRKYRVGMVLAHQYLSQLEPEIRDAVLGNAGTLVSFRLSAADAGYVAREFSPTLEADDMICLPNHRVYLKLMINGEVSKPFSAGTISPTESTSARMPTVRE